MATTSNTTLKVGRTNLALTVFVPVDCKNNCPFCTSKKNYTTHKPDGKAMTAAIQGLMDTAAFAFPDVVITGGEPFANTGLLKDLIDFLNEAVPFKNLYINTTLPQSSIKDAVALINSHDRITGVNVSRHIKTFYYDPVAEKEALFSINKPLHINCVLDGTETKDDILDHYTNYSPFGQVVFRADYTTMNQGELHSMLNPTFLLLDELFGYDYSTQCHVCHTDHFHKHVIYHRGVEHSSIQLRDYKEVNDVVLLQDGSLMLDWDPATSKFASGTDYTIEYPANYEIEAFRGKKIPFKFDAAVNQKTTSKKRKTKHQSTCTGACSSCTQNCPLAGTGYRNAPVVGGSCGVGVSGGSGGCGASSIDDGMDHFMGGC